MRHEPAGALTPSRLAALAVEICEREGLGITVLDEPAISAAGLGGLLGVAAGSDEPPRFIEMVYDPPGARGTVPGSGRAAGPDGVSRGTVVRERPARGGSRTFRRDLSSRSSRPKP